MVASKHVLFLFLFLFVFVFVWFRMYVILKGGVEHSLSGGCVWIFFIFISFSHAVRACTQVGEVVVILVCVRACAHLRTCAHAFACEGAHDCKCTNVRACCYACACVCTCECAFSVDVRMRVRGRVVFRCEFFTTTLRAA